MKNFFSPQNGVLGPKIFFPELNASCSFMPTLPNLKDHYVGPQMLVFIHKNIFLQILTGKAFKHGMFKLRLQIVLYDQNLVFTKTILDSKLI